MRTRNLGRALVFAMVLAAPRMAAADQPTLPPYAGSIRAMGGFGGGGDGLGLRGALVVDGWLSPFAGLGAFLGASSESNFCIFCSSTTYNAKFFGGSVVVRTARGRSYGYWSLGLGYVTGQKQSSPDCPIFGGGCTPAPAPEALSSALFASTLAWLWHPGGVFEIGPAVNVDVTSWDALLTVNLALGFAVGGREPAPE
jgi:hypothetical protein